jgi:uncharacterized membrane protein
MTLGKAILAAVFVAAGILHFVATPLFAKIMPPALPDPVLLVRVSGLFELLGGLGVLLPATQRYAAWGLAALLLAVWPANVTMAIDHAAWPRIPLWALWARVPLQLPLILWAWKYTRAG